jgi:hypothetical protein
VIVPPEDRTPTRPARAGAGSGTIWRLLEENERLRKQLSRSAIHLEILVGRMNGCNDQALEEGRPPTHELVDEGYSFVREAKAALDGQFE